jgi:hypothetical protein
MEMRVILSVTQRMKECQKGTINLAKSSPVTGNETGLSTRDAKNVDCFFFVYDVVIYFKI